MDPGFFLGEGALVSFSTSAPISHIVFFFFSENTGCIRKPQVISGGGGAHPLHPPPRSAPEGISAANVIVGDGAFTKIYLQDGKSKMQHYFLRHSTGKFQGENRILCPSSSNLFLLNGNDLCK